MADFPLDPSQADALLAGGHITPEQYDQMKGVVAPIAPAPIPAAVVDPDEARRQAQRDMFASHKAGVDRMEDESKQRALEFKRQELAEKRDLAKKLGFSAEEINQKFSSKEKDLEKSSMQLANFEPDAETADAPLASEIGYTQDDMRNAPYQQSWDPNSLGYSTQGLDMQQAAVFQAARVGEQKAAAEGSYLRESIRQQEELQKKQALDRAREQELLQTAAIELKDATSELSSSKIDNNRVWANMDTPNKILAGIGLIFGSFGQGGNKGVQALERVIERDIKAQEAAIDTKRSAVTAQQNAYQMMRQRFGDNEIARKAATAAAWEMAEVKLKEIATQYKGQEQGAQALAALGEIQSKKDALQIEVAKQWATKQALMSGDMSLMSESDRERYVPGYGLAPTKEDASKLKDKASAVNKAKDGLDDLIALSKSTGKSLSPNARARAQTIANMLIGELRVEIVGPGAMNESEIQIMRDIIADPTKIMSLDSSNLERLRTLKQRLDVSLTEDLKARGIVPVRDRLGITDREY